ncbi:MAG TPA: S49 family peptidase, partial [Burkholderiaceae bacterium]|nr:S49 family peptidase [Burkholderiaceae bacterium]
LRPVAGPSRHTAMIEITGTIESGGEFTAELINGALRAAFSDPGTAGVVLRINSPGGSPVQAGIVHDEIRRLRTQHPQVPLYAVVEEMCASGAYYIAAAADRIYVDKASIVGSIGVMINGFGLVGTMDKVGVERRLLTAGENKGFLDPFSPLSPEHVAHAQKMLDELHQQFIEVVRRGRGPQLKETPEMFTGLFWTGGRSIELGLADEFGTVRSVAREVIKADDVVDFTRRRGLLERLSRGVGAGAGEALARALAAGWGGSALR